VGQPHPGAVSVPNRPVSRRLFRVPSDPTVWRPRLGGAGLS
jgi:hypothetical protein